MALNYAVLLLNFEGEPIPLQHTTADQALLSLRRAAQQKGGLSGVEIESIAASVTKSRDLTLQSAAYVALNNVVPDKPRTFEETVRYGEIGTIIRKGLPLTKTQKEDLKKLLFEAFPAPTLAEAVSVALDEVEQNGDDEKPGKAAPAAKGKK